MGILSFLTLILFSAETIISPLPDNTSPSANTWLTVALAQTFGDLLHNPPNEKHESVAVYSPTPTITPSHTTVVSPESSPSVTPTSAPAKRNPRKSGFTIALLGNSMIDTLGPGAPHLQKILSKEYPGVTFTIHNLGVGASNIDNGIERLTGKYEYLGEKKPALVDTHPDIVVIESFGYNPFPTDDSGIDRHWMALARAVDVTKTHLPGAKIIIAATIAPNRDVFGDGSPGLSFSPSEKRQKAETIKKYLENTVRFAKSEHLPLADAFHSSLDKSGNGRLVYINKDDHIHYSDAGREFFALKLTEAIQTNRLLE